MSANYTAIPDSVLAILRHRWQLPDGYSAFDATFNNQDQPDRPGDPSFCYLRPGDSALYPDWIQFSHAEAVALINERVFGATAAVDKFGRAVINEHTEHALQDFCAETYQAWAKFQDRARQAETARPSVTCRA